MLNKATISAEVKRLLEDTDGLSQKESQQKFADKLADVIINALKSATVTVQAGIPVSTSGGAGATSGPGSATIS